MDSQKQRHVKTAVSFSLQNIQFRIEDYRSIRCKAVGNAKAVKEKRLNCIAIPGRIRYQRLLNIFVLQSRQA